MPEFGGYGTQLPFRLSRFSAPDICRVKHKRGTIIRWTCSMMKGVVRWRIVDRAWDRHQKEWDYRVVPA